MVWPRMKCSTLGILLLTLVVSSCERVESPTDPLPERQLAMVGGTEYTYLEGQPPGLSGSDPVSVTKTLGLAGGELHLAGHTLRVPAGAVLQPAVFTMTVPMDGYVEVDLQATLLNVLWRILLGLLDPVVGLLGIDFETPVTVELAYGWSTNAPTDPGEIVFLYQVDGTRTGEHEVVSSSLDEDAEVIVAELDHFSRYCLAF